MDVRQILTDMVNAANVDDAKVIAGALKGKQLTEAVAIARQYDKGTAAQRRQGVLAWCIQDAYVSVAMQGLDGVEREAFLGRYVARMLAKVEAAA